jgi:hypothetical protein
VLIKEEIGQLERDVQSKSVDLAFTEPDTRLQKLKYQKKWIIRMLALDVIDVFLALRYFDIFKKNFIGHSDGCVGVLGCMSAFLGAAYIF